MPDFIVLKKTGEGDTAADWKCVLIAFEADEPADAIRQAFCGAGTYRALPWSEEDVAEVDPGEPNVKMGAQRKPSAEPAPLETPSE